MAAPSSQPSAIELREPLLEDYSPSDHLLLEDDEKIGLTPTQPAHVRLISIVLDALKNVSPNVLKPSFLRAANASAKRPTNSLAALDGLRGLACLCVLNQHYSQIYSDRNFLYGWLAQPTDVYLPEFPFVKVLWSGSAQVFTFFVLSGYVLSIKPLRQMRSQSPEIQKTLTSSIFRRGMRLFIPSCAILVVVAIIAQAGIYIPAQEALSQGLVAAPENVVLPKPAFIDMLHDLWGDFRGLTNMWSWSTYAPTLNQHLWTIGIEFRASMLLYLMQAGTCRLKAWIRILIGLCILFYCASTAQDHVLLFFAGMILAELDLAYLTHYEARSDTALAWAPTNSVSVLESIARHFHPKSRSFRLWQLVLFATGLYLMSAPMRGAEATPGYVWLCQWTIPFWYHSEFRSYWFWTIGALLLLHTAVHSPNIRVIYTNRFARYAGKISYAMYLVHGPILHAVAYGLLPFWQSITQPVGGRTTQLGFTLQWLLGAGVACPLIVYFADLVHRLLDMPSVQLARACEEWFEDPRWRDR
ncbi:uncharacterized protein HMPREF1541_10485 [Cyphellophora europaea CBS 101466]|uniref:Acyltransferase 3 domain-containing protein n=1 Tax=Cyphellophora europaea (strain CBS 101466) TaxID=1220924 RepID=W2S6P5_CYPE1|nr:uncharacterized protein HMPREF1541_10485 [Cyphellophora europaea CBS 101466]ETN44305.1 hypothetical protein HMPREF1541_10485 [Cyphellophora europaea CBS 101466]